MAEMLWSQEGSWQFFHTPSCSYLCCHALTPLPSRSRPLFPAPSAGNSHWYRFSLGATQARTQRCIISTARHKTPPFSHRMLLTSGNVTAGSFMAWVCCRSPLSNRNCRSCQRQIKRGLGSAPQAKEGPRRWQPPDPLSLRGARGTLCSFPPGTGHPAPGGGCSGCLWLPSSPWWVSGVCRNVRKACVDLGGV